MHGTSSYLPHFTAFQFPTVGTEKKIMPAAKPSLADVLFLAFFDTLLEVELNCLDKIPLELDGPFPPYQG